MSGRTVIVTGGAGTIGRAIAGAFAGQGDFVAIWDLKKGPANSAARHIQNETAGSAKGFAVDVTKEDQVIRAVKQLVDERGRIDVIVNNAGLQHIDPVEHFPLSKWNRLLDVMLTGPFLLTKHVVPVMKKQKYGRIINISSVHGKTASPFKSAYISAKHGLVGLTKTVALEVADHGITANAVMPGAVDTPLVQNQLEKLAEEEGISKKEALLKHLLNKQAIKRFIRPEEVALCAVYLASDPAGAVTGETISVSGGW